MTMLRRHWASAEYRPCSVPGCQRPAVLGDGPSTPCMPCLLRFGHAAGNPEVLSDGEAALLIEAHGDVVELVTKHPEGIQRWLWKEDQPA